MPTAKMTLLPANDVSLQRKTLQQDMRLDDSLGSNADTVPTAPSVCHAAGMKHSCDAMRRSMNVRTDKKDQYPIVASTLGSSQPRPGIADRSWRV